MAELLYLIYFSEFGLENEGLCNYYIFWFLSCADLGAVEAEMVISPGRFIPQSLECSRAARPLVRKYEITDCISFECSFVGIHLPMGLRGWHG